MLSSARDLSGKACKQTVRFCFFCSIREQHWFCCFTASRYAVVILLAIVTGQCWVSLFVWSWSTASKYSCVLYRIFFSSLPFVRQPCVIFREALFCFTSAMIKRHHSCIAFFCIVWAEQWGEGCVCLSWS